MMLFYSALIAIGIAALARSSSAFFVLEMPGFYAVMFIARQGIHELNWHAAECVNFVFYFGIAYLFLRTLVRGNRKGAES
jgi:hypothetical protein